MIDINELSRNQRQNYRRQEQKKQQLMEGQRKMRGKNICQNKQHQHARAQSVLMFQEDKAKHDNCTIIHLLTDKELDGMKNQGGVVVHVGQPYKLDQFGWNTRRATF